MNTKDENGVTRKDLMNVHEADLKVKGALINEQEEKKYDDAKEDQNEVIKQEREKEESSESFDMKQDECGYMCCIFYSMCDVPSSS